jgi:diguanylate cyclase (GGDEF)-like protein
MQGRSSTRLRPGARGRLWAGGAAAALVIVAFGALGVSPMLAGRSDAIRVNSRVQIAQQIADFRGAVNAWQVYVQPHFADFSAGPARVDAPELAKGAVLAATQQAAAASLLPMLRASGLATNAKELDNVNRAFETSIAKLGTLDGGAAAGVIISTIATETAAFDRLLAVTGDALRRAEALIDTEHQAGIARLERSEKLFVIADGIVAALVLAGAIALGQPARRREQADREREHRQAFEKTLQDALEMAKTETDAYRVMSEALEAAVPRLHVEMLAADSGRAHFHSTLRTGQSDSTACTQCSVSSPEDCPATRRSHALVFPTSRALNACPYLKGRGGELSAACIPISLTGQTSGVVHATGPDGRPPTETETDFLAITSRLAAERIAMVRAFEKSEAQARTDPLTGLMNRRSLENRINELQREGAPYALAYGDLDRFKALNDTHGHEAGDQALRLFSKILVETIRPNDTAARYGGEEFVVVLPDCPIETATAVLERVRERLALALTTGRVNAFTVSFGLAASTDAGTFDEVLAIADSALLDAKATGRNRVVRAMPRNRDQVATVL